MNKERRARLRLAKNKLSEILEEIESILSDEDEMRDNMPENLQNSDRYEESERCSEAMEATVGHIEDAIDSIEEVA